MNGICDLLCFSMIMEHMVSPMGMRDENTVCDKPPGKKTGRTKDVHSGKEVLRPDAIPARR